MITIELPESIAERILPILKSEHEVLGIQIRKIEASLNKETVKARNGAESSGLLPLLTPTKTESGRAKKGESEKLIVEYLKSLKTGQRAAVKEISTATNSAYGSCIRILRKLKSSGLVSVRKRLWGWEGKPHGVLTSISERGEPVQ